MRLFIILIITLAFNHAFAANKIRIGVLAYGTVNWELAVLQMQNYDKKNNLEIEVIKLASKNAVSVALQAKEVDLIVSDFIWVSRQRFQGSDYTFYPYSNATGGLYVQPSLKNKSLFDLQEKEFGIAGGPVSKTWLLLRAYFKFKYKQDFSTFVNTNFASPPLLKKMMLDKSLDASINFWHYNAKLEAKGMHKLLSIKTMLSEMGIKNDIPLIGWVFSKDFAQKNTKLINGFLQASYETKQHLFSSMYSWKKIRKQMKAKDDIIFAALIKGYKEGIPKNFSQKEIKAAKNVFKLLVTEGGVRLAGKSKELQEGTFYSFSPKISW